MNAIGERIVRLAGVLTMLGGLVAGLVSPARAAGDWNDQGIRWLSYDEALVSAQKEHQPICLVFYTEWCPHCTAYSKVFHDAAVVERAKRFTMVRIDRDKFEALSTKFAPDGTYIPRTYFLAADGTIDPELHAPRQEYKYFYDEADPTSLLGGMDAALKKLVK